MKEFTVIIPAYNESKRISSVLLDLCHFLSENNLRWNIIVSIDGNDGTHDLVKQMTAGFPFWVT